MVRQIIPREEARGVLYVVPMVPDTNKLSRIRVWGLGFILKPEGLFENGSGTRGSDDPVFSIATC